MSTIFTTWKEIASYLGKGVRTVQRWESRLGLPVRRPRHGESNIVLAFQSEIDDWARNRTLITGSEYSEVESLRARVEELEGEIAALRTRLEERKKAASSFVSLPRKTVVVVDDNEVHAYALGKVIEGDGYAVLEAHDGKQALQLIALHRPDCVLLDVKLPDFDGFEVCRAIRAQSGRLPAIVFHSAISPHDESRRQAMEMGASAFLTYPVGKEKLLEVVAASMTGFEEHPA